MKLNLRCISALTLAGMMGLTGCSTTTSKDASNVSGEKSVASTAVESKESVALDLFYYDAIRTFRSDSPLWKYIQEQNNIILNGVAPTTPGADPNEQFNLMLASGDLADIIHASKDNMNKNASKLLMPLDDLIEEYAPNLKAALDSDPIMRSASTSPDGKIYYIPYLPDGEVSEVLFIRKDWLDKFNLEVPTTVAAYEEAIRTFRENDANGNGKKDEIGYFDRDNKIGIWGIINFYGAAQEPYVVDGVVKNDKYTPEFKEVIKNVARIYKEGLIDPEIYTRGKNAREYMFIQNIGASTVDWIASTAKFQKMYQEQIPGLEWAPILPPASPSGEVRTQYSREKVSEWVWGISTACKDPVAAIKLFDYMFTEEGRRTMNFGLEGVTYDMVDGKPQFKEEVLNADDTVTNQLLDLGYASVGYKQDFEYERQWTDELALKGIEVYTEAKPFLDIISNLGLSYTEEESKIISEKNPALKSYTEEMVQKWILGSEDIDASFDKYLEKANKLGAQELLDIQQAAYDRIYK